MRIAWLIVGLVAVGATLALGNVFLAGPTEPETTAAEPRTRLLTQQQYENFIASLFGRDVVPTFQFPPLPRTEGLAALGAAEVGVTLSSLERFRQVAGAVAGRATDPKHRYLMPCRPADEAAADAACARQFLSRTSRVLFRRSLSEAEIAGLVDEAGQAADKLHDFYGGLGLVLGSMLYDPEFLLVIDKTEPDPDRPGQLRLTEESVATRLSLFLWNSLPDASLLDAAERGELRDRDSRARIAEAMIQSPRLQDGVRAFFDDMLGLKELPSLSKDPIIYPAFGGAAGREAREQALLMVADHLVTRNQDYRELFTTRQIFMTPDLAALYGVAAPDLGWAPYRVPDDDPRGGGGLLTQIGFLAGNSHPGRSSPTKRGRALREMVLCQKVPDPPPNVDFSGFENPNATLRTARERLVSHSTDPVCAGCHKITDPIGLAMENFDGAGAFRTTEKGAVIDTSGSLDGQDFDTVSGLGQALAASPALPSCVVNRLYAYAIARPTKAQDNAMLKYLEASFQEHGYRVPDLMRSIALSDAFITAGPQSPTVVVDGGCEIRTEELSMTAFNRRRVLRGIVNGGMVTVALPFLDCFLDGNGQALASGSPLPKRFGSWFWGLGMNTAVFVPKTIGPDYDLPAEIAPLAPVRQHINVYTGFDVLRDAKPNTCHHTGWITLRTGIAPAGQRDFPGETIDVTIASAVGRTTRFRSLNVTATGDARDTVSYEGQTSKNAAEASPVAFYQKLFGPEFQDPNAPTFTPSPRVMAEQSVLSGVLHKAKALERDVGAGDRARLDQYFTGLREVERQLAQQLQKPDPIEACRVPGEPQPDEKPGLDVEVVGTRHRLMTELIGMALMCDQTRVYNMVYSNPFAATTKSGRDNGHHGTTHEEMIDPKLGFQPMASWFTTRAMQTWGEHVAALAAIKEGDGTLLDNMLIFAHSDQSIAKIHGVDGIPMFTAGRAGGLLKTGIHVAGNGQPGTRLGYTALRAMGLDTKEWATDSNRTSKEIGEVMA